MTMSESSARHFGEPAVSARCGLRGAGVKAEARRTAGRSGAQSLDAGEHRPRLLGRRRTLRANRVDVNQ